MRITLALPWTAPDGVTHPPDRTVEVDRHTAARLLRAGRARAAAQDPEPAPTADPDEPPTDVIASTTTHEEAAPADVSDPEGEVI